MSEKQNRFIKNINVDDFKKVLNNWGGFGELTYYDDVNNCFNTFDFSNCSISKAQPHYQVKLSWNKELARVRTIDEGINILLKYVNENLDSFFVEKSNDIVRNPLAWHKHFFETGIVEKFKKNNQYSGIDKFETIVKNKLVAYSDEQITALVIQYAKLYLKNPQIEKLLNAGLDNLVYGWVRQPSVLFERNFKNADKLTEITKLPKFAIAIFKEHPNITSNINAWNEMRIWVTKDNLSKEQLNAIFDLGLHNSKIIKQYRKLLTADFDGKKLFTKESLINYLERLDRYQAIESEEAMILLTDYISMCKQMNVEPNVDSNSLKREHDVAARQFREHRNIERMESLRKDFELRYSALSKYEYENNSYIIVAPKTPDDVYDEAKQQRNCVASYCDGIAHGRNNVFFMRKKNDPQKSYITIEVDGNFSKTLQVFYAFNQRVTNQKELDFINSWLEHNQSIELELEDELVQDDEISLGL